MFGRMLNETLGKIHFWGTVIAFNVIFIPVVYDRRGRRPAARLQLRPVRGAVEGPRCSICARLSTIALIW
jgi:hypothetical protein